MHKNIIFYLFMLLLGLNTQAKAADNYAATAGAGLTFAAKDAAGVLYSRFIGCDNTTVSQCWSIDASGRQLITITSGSVASGAFASGSIASGAVASGAVASGAIASGAMVDLGAQADAVCGSATGTCSLIALTKYLNTAVGSSIPAGTNLIGDVNLRQGGNALSTTNGAYFNQLQGNAVLSATNPAFAAPIPTTSGGLSVYFLQPTASTNSNNIKASAGQVYKIDVFNNSATVHYIRLYNTATTGTCNSATNLVWQGIIPASTSGAGLSSSWDLGMAFSSGVALCVTSGYDGTGNATASALIVNVGYK